MKEKLSLLLILGFTLVIGCTAQKTAIKAGDEKKPNVILFLVDDLGWMDVGYNGSSFYETPNIDRFSKEGTRFNQAYAACHVCSPTRGSILTGQYPARTGLTDWLPGRKDFPFQKLQNVTSIQHLPYAATTLPEALLKNGYRTAIFGKWHLGEDSASTKRQGFQVHVPDWGKGWPNGTYFSPYNMKGLEGGKEGEYLTDRLTDEALKYIEDNKDAPFFMYLAHFAVHDPIQGRPDLVKKYEKKLAGMKAHKGPAFILEANPDTLDQLSADQLNALLDDTAYKGYSLLPNRSVKIKQFQDNVEFAAMVESMDESLGRVLSKLKELGIDDNTIVIFFSDNGGMSAANFGRPDRVIPDTKLDKAFSTSNAPLRGAKGWLYEGGIREPMIIKWPHVTQPGTYSNVPVISTDFYPTILDMLQLPLQPKDHVDGVSLVPLLKGESKLNREALYWYFPHYSNHGLQSPGDAIRFGDYKLLEYFENNVVQLFDLKSDPGEQHDLSKAKPDMVIKLKNMLQTWRKNVGARQMPANPDFHTK